ncbi:D-alanyl-D-alanine carboxypeptidase/D-alanyl-D-alanine-endopeptidase [Opitutus sp. ER46]|uniref:D-alanyl-D-alanine carboxypeptidase/D-alanyl-D-alanine endopeptidase n=1 Tax=Opitutus sp. ER46 TaxID=2161864 RepID=UPI001304D8C7|nr:D-alanyl-D-alanine carboxypeptidase/D-alanyl-D-alanine-endopeptidase [Opitutus sp. ER46]
MIPRHWRCVFGWILLLALALWRPARAEEAVAVTGAETLADLRAEVGLRLDAPRFRGSAWGVKVVSVDTGAVLVERDAAQRLSPASNAKLYVAALALDRLGGDWRIKTPVLARGVVDGEGALQGDLVVAGRGDPSWNPRRAGKDFWTAFEPFVALVREAGIRRIRGDVIADGTWLRTTPQGAGWTADDLNDYYGAEISGVALEENYLDLRVGPGAVPGAPGVIELVQPLTGLQIDNRLTTVTESGARQVRVLRLPGERWVTVFGTVPAGGGEALEATTVPRPAEWFATGMKEALRRAGIEVTGRARGVRWPELTPDVRGARQLGEIVSPTLREMVSVLLKVSQNLRTDLLFATLGELERQPETSAWRTADELALTALGRFLREHDLRPGDVQFDEGSGLSRNNLVTADAMVRLLRFMAQHREAAAFADALPVAGRDGTLRGRMKGTPAEGQVQAKTGTLRWANSLSGYVTTAAGERLAFCFMLNRHVAPADHRTRDELDELAVMLARYRGDSR